MLDSKLGICPIQPELPGGSNPRDGDTFGLLEAEINKRLDLHAQTATDWPLVSKLATTILRDEGKDLSVATWLMLAWTYCEGASGLVTGVRVLHDVHVHHWDTMSPPVKRLRGRRNQMEWLLQELETVLARNSSEWAALQAQQHAQLMADWDALDALWQGYDDQAPALFKLRRTLMDLAPSEDDSTSTVETDTLLSSAEPHAAAGTADSSGVTGATAESDTTETARPAEGVRSKADAQAPEAHIKTTNAVAPRDSAPRVGSGVAGVVPESAAEVEQIIDQGFEAMHALLRDVPDELIMMPVLYRLNRVRAWMALDVVPPTTEGVSRIPAPPPADQDGLQRLIDASDPGSVLRFAESRLVSHRFWLDLNRIACQAAQALPDGQPVADAIAHETMGLLQRLPGLQDLSFNNHQAFADSATHDWLASLNTATAVPVTRLARADQIQSDIPADTLGMATLLAAAGAETQAAARLLDVVAARLQSGSEQFIQR